MPISDYTPTLAQTASHVRSRTKRAGSGQELGTFTAETRPSDEEANQMIAEALLEVSSVVGPDIPDALGDDPDALRNAASGLVSLLAAMTVESSFYPEQVGAGRSNYAALERRYERGLKKLESAVAQAGGATAGDEGATGSMRPSYDFGDHEMTEMDEEF